MYDLVPVELMQDFLDLTDVEGRIKLFLYADSTRNARCEQKQK